MKKRNLASLNLNKKSISALNATELNYIVGASGDICQTVPRLSACNGPCLPPDVTKKHCPILKDTALCTVF